MTFEEMIALTGFRGVGDGKKASGRGMLFGFPTEVVTIGKGLIFVCSVDTLVTAKQYKAIRRRLKQDERTKGKLTVTATIHKDASNTTGKFFSIMFNFGKEDPTQLYEQIMPLLEVILREEGVYPAVNCPICELTGGDSLATYGGRTTIVHMRCLQKRKDEQLETLELKKYSGGHFRGIIGGLIGGVVGAIPALFALYFFEYYVGVLFAIIPVGIYYGWKLFGGIMSRFTTVFAILYTIVVAVLVDLMHIWLVIRAEFPRWQITFAEMIELYFHPQAGEYLRRSSLMALLFSAIGIFVAWRLITRTDKHELADLETAIEQAIPISPEDR